MTIFDRSTFRHHEKITISFICDNLAPILVRFQQQNARDDLFNNYLKERNLSLLDIIPSMGIRSRVYIGENTTPACRILIKRCAIMRKNSLIHRYHTRQGRLFIQRVPDGPLQPVTAGILDNIEKEPPISLLSA